MKQSRLMSLVEAITNKQPKQVKITTKFVEISQENGEELGFDWVVGPFGLSANNVFGAGGTTGNGTVRNGDDFTGPLIPGVPLGDSGVNNIVTAGNRTLRGIPRGAWRNLDTIAASDGNPGHITEPKTGQSVKSIVR